MLSWYIAKCKYTLKLIQIIAKLYEVLIHILNVNWFDQFNYNWKVWFMWFHKKTIEHFDEKLLSFENDKNYVEGLCIKIYQNVRWIKEKLSQKYTKIYPKIVHFLT
jgi:hypothetical protein